MQQASSGVWFTDASRHSAFSLRAGPQRPSYFDALAGQVDVVDCPGDQLAGRSPANRAVAIARYEASGAASLIANASVRVRTAGWRE